MASCGSATCPINLYQPFQPKRLQLGIAYEYIHQDQLYVGTSKSFVGAIHGDHDEVSTLNKRVSFQLKYGLITKTALSLEIPYIQREHQHIHHDAGGDELETWSFSGLGDMTAGEEIVLKTPSSHYNSAVSLLLSVKLPTGKTHIKNENKEEAEVSIQPGSGSTDVTLGLNMQKNVHSMRTRSGKFVALPLTLNLSYRLNGTGTNGWRVGNVFLTHAGTEYPLSDNISLLFQLNGRFQPQASPGSTGEAG